MNNLNLTKTELKIQKYSAEGKSITQIAEILNISHHTVNSYINSINKKIKKDFTKKNQHVE